MERPTNRQMYSFVKNYVRNFLFIVHLSRPHLPRSLRYHQAGVNWAQKYQPDTIRTHVVDTIDLQKSE